MRLPGILSAAVSFLLYNCAESTTINKLTGVAEEDTRRLRSVDFTKSATDMGEERRPGLAQEIRQSLGEGPLKESIARMSQEEAMKPLREQSLEEGQRKRSIARISQEDAMETSSRKKIKKTQFVEEIRRNKNIIATMSREEARETLRELTDTTHRYYAMELLEYHKYGRLFNAFRSNGFTERDVRALLLKCGLEEYDVDTAVAEFTNPYKWIDDRDTKRQWMPLRKRAIKKET